MSSKGNEDDLHGTTPERPLAELFRSVFELVDTAVEGITDDEVEEKLQQFMGSRGEQLRAQASGGKASLGAADAQPDDRTAYRGSDMERLAAQAAEELADAPAEEIVRWAVDTFGSRLCITSSMTDAVIIHLASNVQSGLDVIFLDTGYHFPETIGTRDAVSAVYPVNVINVTPSRTVAEQDAELGPRLYGRNPDLCCYFRKVVPLERALDPYDAWITGVRREETDARSDTKAVQWDPRRQMVQVNPIVAWTQDQVDAYIAEQGVLVNPLVYDGYTTITCSSCSLRGTEQAADPRTGRWAANTKVTIYSPRT